MSSHELGLNVNTWEDLYTESFPMQATLAIVVGKTNKNSSIIKDLSVAIKNSELEQDLKNVGIFPTLSTKQRDINNVLKNNDQIKSLIIKNNIRLK